MTMLSHVLVVVVVLWSVQPLGAYVLVGNSSALRQLADTVSLSGSLRGAYWSSSRNLDGREHLAVTSLWLKGSTKLWAGASLVAEGRIVNQQLFRATETDASLREAYVDMNLGSLDVRVGKQIIAWGRADRINPTDNITPRDFTLLVSEDDEQRFGVMAVKATYYWRDVALTGIWLPHFETDRWPMQTPPPPLTIRQREPHSVWEQWAVKLEQTGKAIDWSVSYFHGFDPFPDFEIGRVSPTRVELLLRNHRIDVIGADIATSLGRYGVRAEAAYTFTEDAGGRNPEVKNPFFFLVLGADRTFFESFNVNLQYLIRVVTNYQSPFKVKGDLPRGVALQQAVQTNQLDRVQRGITLRLNNRWWNDTLEGEIVSVVSFTRGGYLLRPKLIYALTDRWKIILGADIFRGIRPSFFENLRSNSAAYTEVRYSF